jgi:acylphosphatase
MAGNMEKRYRLQFYGMVQGVGFRFTATHAANMCRLTGYVKNEYDGSVTCEVQGEEESIDEFIRIINAGRFISIDRIVRTELALDGDERSFDVRF